MYVTNTIKENKAVKLRAGIQWKVTERGWGEEGEEEKWSNSISIKKILKN